MQPASTMPTQARLRLAACAVALVVGSVAGCSRTDAPVGTANAAPPVATTTVGTEIDDTVVTTKVKSALLGDQDVKGFDIKVETRKGVVLLGGFVDNQSAIDRAISVASRVNGVKSVENAMTIKAGRMTVGNEVDDGIVTTRVKSALLADAVVKSFDIAVVTRKGKVQLSGFVDSQAQIDRAMTVTRGVKDVAAVENELKIKK
jgi:hyperosmotically inducible protein